MNLQKNDISQLNQEKTYAKLILTDASQLRIQTVIVGINPLALGKFDKFYICIIFKQNLVTAGWGISCEITLI